MSGSRRVRGRGLRLGLDDVTPLTYGSAVLASGGGGAPHLAEVLLTRELKRKGAVQLVAPNAIKAHWRCATVALGGSPTVLMEKLPNLTALAHAIRALERHCRIKINALTPIEAGGFNTILPLIVGARLGLPVIDGDGMGRAFPETHMTTFAINGGRVSPAVVADDHLGAVVIDVADNVQAERHLRASVETMGSLAAIALYPMHGADVRANLVPRSLSECLAIGRAVFKARRLKANPAEALIAHFNSPASTRRGAVRLFDGKVTDAPRRTQGGFAKGRVQLESAAGVGCTIEFQNEYLSAQVDGRVVATTPDIITLLDEAYGDPIAVEDVRYGQRVSVIGVTAPDALRAERALAVVGPQAFGLATAYCPLEELNPPRP